MSIEITKEEITKESIVGFLWKRARYSVLSYSETLIYKTLGAIDMAIQLGVVSYVDVCDIQQYLIHNHLNNAQYMSLVHNHSF